MMRNRAGVIIVEESQVCLIKRVVKGAVYYVFPGGGIEEGETAEEAAAREAFEELGLNVSIKDCIVQVSFNGNTQYYFKADRVEGTFGSGTGDEFSHTSSERGTYTPVWLKLEELACLDVRPQEVVEVLLKPMAI